MYMIKFFENFWTLILRRLILCSGKRPLVQNSSKYIFLPAVRTTEEDTLISDSSYLSCLSVVAMAKILNVELY